MSWRVWEPTCCWCVRDRQRCTHSSSSCWSTSSSAVDESDRRGRPAGEKQNWTSTTRRGEERTIEVLPNDVAGRPPPAPTRGALAAQTPSLRSFTIIAGRPRLPAPCVRLFPALAAADAPHNSRCRQTRVTWTICSTTRLLFLFDHASHTRRVHYWRHSPLNWTCCHVVGILNLNRE